MEGRITKIADRIAIKFPKEKESEMTVRIRNTHIGCRIYKYLINQNFNKRHYTIHQFVNMWEFHILKGTNIIINVHTFHYYKI
jgi:hypothetical protein